MEKLLKEKRVEVKVLLVVMRWGEVKCIDMNGIYKVKVEMGFVDWIDMIIVREWENLRFIFRFDTWENVEKREDY